MYGPSSMPLRGVECDWKSRDVRLDGTAIAERGGRPFALLAELQEAAVDELPEVSERGEWARPMGGEVGGARERAREKEEREKAQETERANERESDGGHASKGAAEDSKQLQSPSLSPDGRPIDPATGLPVKRKPGECLGNLLPRF
mgnify:CR=1 FL=1